MAGTLRAQVSAQAAFDALPCKRIGGVDIAHRRLDVLPADVGHQRLEIPAAGAGPVGKTAPEGVAAEARRLCQPGGVKQAAQQRDQAVDVQGVLAGQLESQPCTCLWLIGLPAIRFAGEGDADSYNRELTIDGLGPAWALPGLELLMDEPARKRELWQAMRRAGSQRSPSPESPPGS